MADQHWRWTGRLSMLEIVMSVGAHVFFGATWWDAGQAIGTLAAVFVAVGVALVESVRAFRATRDRDRLLVEHAQADRISAASLVSAWVETEPEPSLDGTHYIQRTRVYLSNASAEPVYNVHALIGIGEQPVVQIGPLAVPVPIPVLPARRERSWDVSLGVLAHSRLDGRFPVHPVARLYFSDARGVRWQRDFEGRLTEAEGMGGTLLAGEATPRDPQLGNLTSFFNPMAVALEFHLYLLSDDGSCSVENLSPLLDENAPGWDALDERMVEELRGAVAGYVLAAHVWYPAPFVAYARLVHDDDAEMPISTAGFVSVRANVITLNFSAERGWRVFSLGVTPPDWMEFPKGTLTGDPRSKANVPSASRF